MAGHTPLSPILDGADGNRNGRIDMADVIFLFQDISGTRRFLNPTWKCRCAKQKIKYLDKQSDI